MGRFRIVLGVREKLRLFDAFTLQFTFIRSLLDKAVTLYGVLVSLEWLVIGYPSETLSRIPRFTPQTDQAALNPSDSCRPFFLYFGTKPQ